MSLFVQKFGGSSVESVARIQHVAEIIQSTLRKGQTVIAVVSAMGEETDRLLALAKQLNPRLPDREYSALLASGEQVSAALLAMALEHLGIRARSYQAFQIQLETDNQYCKARVSSVNCERLQADIDQGIVPVVTGFQGINERQEITTLGRGGSDITAVALAAFMHAAECQIFTDVDGVYSADPRLVPEAHLIDCISYDEMLTYASLGAKVLQQNSVEMARKYNVALRVLSSLKPSLGTLVTAVKTLSDTPLVSGIACEVDQVKVTMKDLPHAQMFQVLSFIEHERIDMDMLWQHPKSKDLVDISFVIAEHELTPLCKFTTDMHVQSGMAKLSLVGQSMHAHAGFSAEIMYLLCEKEIHIHTIASSASKVSVLIDVNSLKTASHILHNKFKINKQLTV